MKIAILGASGFIGSNLVKILLNNTDHEIVAIARKIEKMNVNSLRLTKISCDVFNTLKLKQSLRGVDDIMFDADRNGDGSSFAPSPSLHSVFTLPFSDSN